MNLKGSDLLDDGSDGSLRKALSEGIPPTMAKSV
jgi:hypothetical protein